MKLVFPRNLLPLGGGVSVVPKIVFDGDLKTELFIIEIKYWEKFYIWFKMLNEKKK